MKVVIGHADAINKPCGTAGEARRFCFVELG